MITEKTVFILGAGASCPYGFPSGAQLRKLICNGSEFMSRFRNYPSANGGNKKNEAQGFINAFDKSHAKSIDRFLAENAQFSSIGKYIIAFKIFEAERRSHFDESATRMREYHDSLTSKEKLKSPMHNGFYQGGDWYSYIYNYHFPEGLAGKKALPNFSSVSFITFNYDRSLEHFLFQGLCHLYSGFTKNDIAQCLKELKIVHVYGNAAPLDWQSQDSIPYGPLSTEEFLDKASQNIKTIHEERQNLELEEAKKLISEANHIFFLGFGYASENMAILQLPEMIPQRCKVCGTAYGLESKEVKTITDAIIRSINNKTEKKKGFVDYYGYINNRIVIQNMDCLKLLRNYL